MTIRMIPIIASSCALLSVSSAADLPENMTQKTADRVEAISNRAMLLAKTKFEDFRNGRLTDLDRFAISSYQQFLVVHPEATLAIEDIVGWDGGVGVLRRDTKKNITPVAHASNQTQVHIILPKSLLSKIPCNSAVISMISVNPFVLSARFLVCRSIILFTQNFFEIVFRAGGYVLADKFVSFYHHQF